MTRKKIAPDLATGIRAMVIAERVATSMGIASIRSKLGVSYHRIKEVAGDLIEQNRRKLIQQIREEYKNEVQECYGQPIRVLLSKCRSMKILNNWVKFNRRHL